MARLVIRAVIIVLMTLVAAVPALAESGCLEAPSGASFTNLAAAAPSITTTRHDEGDRKASFPGNAVHCAPNHCAHGVPASPPEQDVTHADCSTAVYARSIIEPLLDAGTDGPDHPPRA